MILKNYKHIKHLEFNLNQSQFICTKDFLIKNDLLELSRLIFENKKIPSDVIVKWTEFDHLYNLKNLKVIFIPSFIDFQKDFISGNKSLLKTLVYEILTIIEPQNNCLIEVQNLLGNFKLEEEFTPLQDFVQQIKEHYDFKFESNISDSIVNILIEQIKINLVDKWGTILTESTITLEILKNLYIEFLVFLTKIVDEEILIIFDDPFYGLKRKDIKVLNSIMKKLPNKFVCCFTFPLDLSAQDLQSVALVLSEKTFDFSNILNNLEDYKFFVDEPIPGLVNNVLNNWLSNYDKFDDESLNGEFIEIKNEEILFKAILNQ